MASKFGVLPILLAVSGCASLGAGGATPAVGGKPSVTAISALGGGLIGGSIGQDLSTAEKRKALEAEYRALEYSPGGQTVAWASGGDQRGEVVAAQPYRVGSQDCRQYVHTLYSGNGSQTARGTACRNGDGSWSLLS